MILIKGDYSEVNAELDRLIGMPDPQTSAALTSVLEAGFGLTQMAVHIDTGSLKSSGKSSSSTDESSHEWEGKIRYGGPSGGINNPVNYAIYEKRRGGIHDFFLDLPTLHPMYLAAIMKGLRG